MLPSRSASSECFSDLAIDRGLAGDLDGDAAAALDAHAASCARCGARLATLTRERDAFLAAPPLRRERPVRRRAWLVASSVGASLAAAFALALVVTSTPDVDVLRPKGGEPQVSFFVKRGEQVMHEAVGVFLSIEQDARRTLALAEAVLRASENQDALVRQVNDASTLVATAAESSSEATDEAARAMQHQRSLTEQLRETAYALERSAGSLGEVVSRFGTGGGEA